MEPTYSPDLNLAGLRDPLSGISVFTLLQRPGEKAPAIAAYLAARYSRSSDSLPEIIKEAQAKGTDAADRLGKIFHGYGHASVGDMAQLFIYVENVPMVTAMRFFYLNPTQSGQERSTRYQNFSQPRFFNSFPQSLPAYLQTQYQSMLSGQFEFYSRWQPAVQDYLATAFRIDQNDPTEQKALTARTFDTVRYAIPLGTLTNFGAVMSARDWARYIGLLRGSSQHVEQLLGEQLFALLTGHPALTDLGYVPEASELVRYTSPNTTIESTTANLLEQLAFNHKTGKSRPLPRLRVSYNSAQSALVEHVYMLMAQHITVAAAQIPYLSERFGRLVHSQHNQYNQLGPIAQHGAIQIRGVTDMGTLKDLNRHRSLEHFIPFLDNKVNWEFLLGAGCDYCPYIEPAAFRRLRQQFDEHYERLVDALTAWADQASRYLPSSQVVEYVRYALPHAHRSEYCFYGSSDDLIYTIGTRIRPGGHISYRLLMMDWLRQLSELDPFWLPLLEQQELYTPNASDRAQFLNRS